MAGRHLETYPSACPAPLVITPIEFKNLAKHYRRPRLKLSPAIKYRCIARNKHTGGIAARIAPADIKCHDITHMPWSDCRPAVTGRTPSEPHCRPRYRFANRFRIGRVGLPALHIRLDVSWWPIERLSGSVSEIY